MTGANIGIDLGTSSLVMYAQGKGIVLSEPMAVAYDSDNGNMVAVGSAAYRMLGRNPDSLRVVKPMRDGVISDFTATKQILRYFLGKYCGNMVFKPNILVCVPSAVINLERRTILDLVTASGAGRACLIEEPLAAALGAGLKSDIPRGSMVVDIGGGTTDVAVMTMGSLSISRSVKCAGNALDEAIAEYLRREKEVVIGERSAELIKMKIGCAYPRDVELGMPVKGKHYITGMPLCTEVTSSEIFTAMRPQLERIVESVRSVLEITPPELVADISVTGIHVTGGGALLNGIDKMLKEKTGIDTYISLDPLNCVARGTGVALENEMILRDNGCVFQTREEIGGLSDLPTDN